MKIYSCCWLLALVFHAGTAVAASDYRLGISDQIAIYVYGEPDLSMNRRVNESGAVSFPFLGEIQAEGLTVSQMEDRIEAGLKGDYLMNPVVSVSISKYRNFFINGAVVQPGGYAFSPGLTARKAVALAGGFTERALRSRVDVTPETSDGDEDVSSQRSMDDLIGPGEIITVRQRVF